MRRHPGDPASTPIKDVSEGLPSPGKHARRRSSPSQATLTAHLHSLAVDSQRQVNCRTTSLQQPPQLSAMYAMSPSRRAAFGSSCDVTITIHDSEGPSPPSAKPCVLPVPIKKRPVDVAFVLRQRVRRVSSKPRLKGMHSAGNGGSHAIQGPDYPLEGLLNINSRQR